ncbi:MAG TPA: spore coat protein U domain-containing protein [Pseudomonadaceae bacterium]|nr:spore coat protein U domain-containing protein [Pseudomonadaceae bacterium]
MLKPVHVLSLSLLAAAITTVAQAADTTSFDVTPTITESCDIDTVAATDVEFGTHAYSLAGVNLTAAGSLSVNCSVGTDYEIELNNGANFSGSRRMTDGTNFVPYALNLPNTSTIWDDTNTYSDTGNGAVQVIPVNGVVTDLNFPAGSYSDTVIAKVTF